MKSVHFTKAFVVISALLLYSVTCLGQNDAADRVAGTWIKVVDTNTITFSMTADGKLEVELTGDEVVDVYGSYEISGSRITFHDEGGEYSSGTSGVYEYRLGENTISFTKIDDPVEGRSMLITGSWSKADETQ